MLLEHCAHDKIDAGARSCKGSAPEPAGLTFEPCSCAERTLTHIVGPLLQRFSVIVSELVLVTAVFYMTR